MVYWLLLEFEFWCLTPLSAISWRPVLVVERITDPGQATGNLYHLQLRVECTFFGNLQSWVRTHTVLVIGLYELLDPTT
jgi:hypothetical protein